MFNAKYIVWIASFFCTIIILNTTEATAQTTTIADTFFLAKKKGLLGKLGKSIAIETAPYDTGTTIKIANRYLPFYNKKIVSITYQNVNFGGSVNDTTANKKGFFIKLGDNLQPKTTYRAIKNTLFFSVGDLVNPNLLSDNERFLREQPFLQDASLLMKTNIEDTNSVDITIVYKNIFSLGGEAIVNGTNVYATVKDDNFLGTAQRVSFQSYYDLNRANKYGFGFEYLKRSIKGSFINFSIGYQNIAPTFNTGNREEVNFYSRIELPLVSTFSLFTGSIEASSNYSTNNYLKDSLYHSDLKYAFQNYDAWLGYNITSKTVFNEGTVRKTKQFLAIRFTNKIFNQVPTKFINNYNFAYSNISSVLATYTIFKQDYYRTNYLYGFGRNEDVPEGFNLAFTTGYTNRNNYNRPYAGIDLQRNFFTHQKSYFNYSVKMGSYFRNNKMEDVSLLFGVETFTKLRKLGNSKWYLRHFLNASLSNQFNRFLDEPLRLNSIYGIQQFGNDSSTLALGRFSISGESVFYNTWKLVGFSFAPFLFTNISYLRTQKTELKGGDGYLTIGAGIRSRNENLIFGTLELKAFYFPRTTNFMAPFNIQFNTDLRFRYNSQYIKRPDFISIN